MNEPPEAYYDSASKGRVPLSKMHDDHLVNATRKARRQLAQLQKTLAILEAECKHRGLAIWM